MVDAHRRELRINFDVVEDDGIGDELHSGFRLELDAERLEHVFPFLGGHLVDVIFGVDSCGVVLKCGGGNHQGAFEPVHSLSRVLVETPVFLKYEVNVDFGFDFCHGIRCLV